MSITNPLSFSNTNCLGNALTYNKPCSFSARIKNNATVKLSTTDYIYFGKQDNFVNTSKITFQFSPFSGNTNVAFNSFSSGKWDICSNIISNVEYRIKRATIVFAADGAANVEIIVNNSSYTGSFTRSASYILPVRLELNTSGVPILSINGEIALTLSQDSTVNEENDNIAYFNSFKSNDATGHIANGLSLSIRNYSINLFNPTGEVIHAYRLAEGYGDIIYDAVGTLDGRLIASSLSDSRITEPLYKYPYNAIYGFKQDESLDTAFISSLIPENRNSIILYKSDFTSGKDVFTNNIGTKPENEDSLLIQCLYSAARATIATIATFNNKGGIYFPTGTNKQLGRSFNVKFNLKNVSTTNIVNVIVQVGNNQTANNGLTPSVIKVLTEEERALANSADGLDISMDLDPLESSNGTTIGGVVLWVQYQADIEPNENCYKLSDVLISQTNFIKYHPKVENGLNSCESSLDFTRTIANVSELYQIDNANNVSYIHPYANPDKNMGADEGWNITSAPTSLIAKGVWRANTRVLYLVSETPTVPKTGIPDSWVNIKTNTFISNDVSANCLFSKVGDLSNLNYRRFRCSYSLKYKLNSVNAADTGRLDVGMGYTSFKTILNKDITNTDWHEISGESYFYINQLIANDSMISFGISWTTSDNTLDYAGSIADCEFKVFPEELTLNPIAFKIDHDAQSISNISVYKKEFDPSNTPIQMNRVANHVNHF